MEREAWCTGSRALSKNKRLTCGLRLQPAPASLRWPERCRRSISMGAAPIRAEAGAWRARQPIAAMRASAGPALLHEPVATGPTDYRAYCCQAALDRCAQNQLERPTASAPARTAAPAALLPCQRCCILYTGSAVGLSGARCRQGAFPLQFSGRYGSNTLPHHCAGRCIALRQHCRTASCPATFFVSRSWPEAKGPDHPFNSWPTWTIASASKMIPGHGRPTLRQRR